MGISIEVLISIFAVLSTISLSVERLLEAFAPVFAKITVSWQSSVKLIVAIVLGFGLAALFQFDLLAKIAVVGISPFVGYGLSGLISSTGSTAINRFLGWLKTLKPS